MEFNQEHYDANMSEIFFHQLELRAPDMNLGVGSGSHAEQTAKMMIGLDPIIIDRKPDIALVYGDVNSTVASARNSAGAWVEEGHPELHEGKRDVRRRRPVTAPLRSYRFE